MKEIKQIRVSQQVYNMIDADAKGLLDNADAVLRRKYGLPPKTIRLESKKNKPKKR